MTTRYKAPHTSPHFQGLTLPANPTSGTEDDFDDRDDEHVGENEASIRANHEGTEIPEEFDVLILFRPNLGCRATAANSRRKGRNNRNQSTAA
jgi:hypothetical protein